MSIQNKRGESIKTPTPITFLKDWNALIYSGMPYEYRRIIPYYFTVFSSQISIYGNTMCNSNLQLYKYSQVK